MSYFALYKDTPYQNSSGCCFRHIAGFSCCSRKGGGKHALEGKGPQTPFQWRLDRRLEEVDEAVGGGYCRLEMPLKLARGVRGTVAWHRPGAR